MPAHSAGGTERMGGAPASGRAPVGARAALPSFSDSVPPLPTGAELERLCLEQVWPRQSRYDRILIVLTVAVLLASLLVDRLIVSDSRRFLWIVTVHIVGVLAFVPMWLATRAPSPPRTYSAVRLLLSAVIPTVLTLKFWLAPTHILHQGWAMIIACAVLHVALEAPLRPKLAVSLGTFALYAASIASIVRDMGAAYGKPAEIFSVLIVGVGCALVVPFVAQRASERRVYELSMRMRLEREIALREEREHALSVAKEIAERAERDAHQQQERADMAAEAALRESRDKSALLANMSHDLRTPMAGILGIVDLLRGTSLSDEQAGYLETIRSSNQTLLALLNDIVDFSRIEEGKLPLSPSPSPFAETIRAPVELLRVTAERKGLRLRVEIPQDAPALVSIDAARVQQVLLNLVGNAIKFTQSGSVTVRAILRPWASGKGTCRVEVEDTGIGFTREQGARLFQRYRQAEDSIAQGFGGSGLGLSICKGLVELMGGRIGAESEPGRGARFWIEIPTEEAEPSRVEESVELPTLRILLAEDNAVNQMVIGRMLDRLGQKVSFASDGQEALHMLTSQHFDMAILDLHMPIMNGDEVARRVRQISAAKGAICLVALTAGPTIGDDLKTTFAEFDGAYSKPIDLDGLRRMLTKEGSYAVARKKARSAAHLS